MYIFVIDTDSYAGNFEREMTAYVTGCYGDCGGCGVGAELVSEFTKDGLREGYFDDLVVQEPDEHGCYHPCRIWDTPGWFNDGLGNHWRDGQEVEAKQKHRQACLERSTNLHSVHPRNADDHKQRWLDRVDAPLVKYPAFNSVAIFLEREPTEEELRVLKERALKWTKGTKKIAGFRLIHKVTEYTELQKWENE